MLLQKNVLQFLNAHRFHTMEGCNFFYKSHEGAFIDADARTASIAGVDGKEIINKRDVELRWGKYSDQYRQSDKLALSQSDAIIKIEENINLFQKDVLLLVLKHPVVKENAVAGIFGASFYIDEMPFSYFFQILDFLRNSLFLNLSSSIKPQWTFDATPQLSYREKECAQLLCMGMSAREIALNLNLSKRTVESYLQTIKDKLHVKRKSELIRKLFSNNLVDL